MSRPTLEVLNLMDQIRDLQERIRLHDSQMEKLDEDWKSRVRLLMGDKDKLKERIRLLEAQNAGLKEILGDIEGSGEETNEETYARYLMWCDNFHKMKSQVADLQARIDRAKGLAEKWAGRGYNPREYASELLAALDGEPKKGGVDGLPERPEH